MHRLILAATLALSPTEDSCGGSDDEAPIAVEAPGPCHRAPALRLSDAASWPSGDYSLYGLTAEDRHLGCAFTWREDIDDIDLSSCTAGASVLAWDGVVYFFPPPALGARFRLLATHEAAPFLSDVWVAPLTGVPCETGLADVPGAPAAD